MNHHSHKYQRVHTNNVQSGQDQSCSFNNEITRLWRGKRAGFPQVCDSSENQPAAATDKILKALNQPIQLQCGSAAGQKATDVKRRVAQRSLLSVTSCALCSPYLGPRGRCRYLHASLLLSDSPTVTAPIALSFEIVSIYLCCL